jgi:uncharacterized protein YlxW (UPF0749 family)
MTEDQQPDRRAADSASAAGQPGDQSNAGQPDGGPSAGRPDTGQSDSGKSGGGQSDTEQASGWRDGDRPATEPASGTGQAGGIHPTAGQARNVRPGGGQSADRPSTLGGPGMPAAGRRPAAGAEPPAAGPDVDPPLDPHAPLSADGPTVRLSAAMLSPRPPGNGPAAPNQPGDDSATPNRPGGGPASPNQPGDGAASGDPAGDGPPSPDPNGRMGSEPAGEDANEPADRPVEAGDEPTVVSRPVARDDEATTVLTPPPGPAPADDEPATETPSLRGGETMRLQPPFFAPGTTRTPRPAPDTSKPHRDPAGESPAGTASRDQDPAPPGEWRDDAELHRWADSSTDAAADRDEAEPHRWADSPTDAAAEPDRWTERPAGAAADRDEAEPRRWADSPTGAAADRDDAEAHRWADSPDDADKRPDGEAWSSGAAAEPGREAAETPKAGTPAVPPEGMTTEDDVSPVRTDGAAAVPEKAAPRRRLSTAGALIWLLLALLGFTLVVQVQSNDDDAGLATARQEDLVGILSDLEARDQRLQQEINALEESQRQLTSGVAGRQAALAEADKRADELGLLSGTLPARGPGLKISIDPQGQPIKASAILNAVQELRGAGGEVMEIVGDNGVAVRIVASSYFVDADGGRVTVDGKQLSGPYTLWVIGVPATMQTALQIPGGVVASVSQAGGNVTMEQRTTVEVTAVRQPTSLQYARPVS